MSENIQPAIPNYFQLGPYRFDPTQQMRGAFTSPFPYNAAQAYMPRPDNAGISEYQAKKEFIPVNNAKPRVINGCLNATNLYKYYQDTLVNLSLLCKHVEFDKYGRHDGKFCWQDIHSKSIFNSDNMDSYSKQTNF